MPRIVIEISGTFQGPGNYKLSGKHTMIHVVPVKANPVLRRPPTIRIECQFDLGDTGMDNGWHSSYWNIDIGDWSTFEFDDFAVDYAVDEIFLSDELMWICDRPIGKSWDHSPYTAFAP